MPHPFYASYRLSDKRSAMLQAVMGKSDGRSFDDATSDAEKPGLSRWLHGDLVR
jgi:hypothetical protein